MAPPQPPASALTAEYRSQSAVIRAATMRDMLRLWPALDWSRLAQTYPAWFSGVSALVDRNRGATSLLASQYVQAFRDVAGVPAAVTVLAPPADPAAVAAVMRINAPVAFKIGVGNGLSVPAASANALVQATGTASRLVLDAGRDTVRLTVAADPAATGWRRVGNAKTCDFCAMLLGRGAVYKESTAGFRTHAHCACSAEPVFDGLRYGAPAA